MGLRIYEDELGRFSCMRMFTQVIRVVVEFISHVLMILTYQFYGMSGSQMNSGIITSLFASSIVYTAIIFYFLYGQRVAKVQALGMVFIIVSVVLVSIGSQSNVKSTLEGSAIVEENKVLLNWSIVFALLCGLILSIQLLTTKKILQTYDFPPNHMNYDTNFGLFLLYFIIYLVDGYAFGMHYETIDFFLMTSAGIIGQVGMLFLTQAVRFGKGSIVQSIENLKIPMQVLILLIATGGRQKPTLLQNIGVLFGLLGGVAIAVSENQNGK